MWSCGYHFDSSKKRCSNFFWANVYISHFDTGLSQYSVDWLNMLHRKLDILRKRYVEEKKEVKLECVDFQHQCVVKWTWFVHMHPVYSETSLDLTFIICRDSFSKLLSNISICIYPSKCVCFFTYSLFFLSRLFFRKTKN